jgi:hypothetical protein
MILGARGTPRVATGGSDEDERVARGCSGRDLGGGDRVGDHRVGGDGFGRNPVAGGHRALDCRGQSTLCTEVADSEAVFGSDVYVGHDEPSVLFYSNQDGAGYRMRYQLTLPKDPPPTPKPGRSYNFELHPAFWFGLAMCDTQSYPEQTSTCTPHSDTNITTDPTKHPGTAFMEMQFYPPGWAGWNTVGTSCDPTKWCAALNIDSLSQDPISGKQLNRPVVGQFAGHKCHTLVRYAVRVARPLTGGRPPTALTKGKGTDYKLVRPTK